MSKMIIVRGKAYNMTFIIKKVGSPTPLELSVSDTATIYINQKNADNTLLLTKELSQGEAINGEFVLSLTADETKLLPFDIGFTEDGSKFTSTCRGHISTVTVENGNGEIMIENIYVADIGL